MNKVIDKGFRSCRFVSTIVKHPPASFHESQYDRLPSRMPTVVSTY